MYYGVRLPVERAGTHPFAFGLHRSRQVARGIPDEVRIFPSSPFLHPSFAARACIGPLHGVDTDEVDGRTIAVSTFVGGCPPYDDVVARIQKKKKKRIPWKTRPSLGARPGSRPPAAHPRSLSSGERNKEELRMGAGVGGWAKIQKPVTDMVVLFGFHFGFFFFLGAP